MYSIDPKEYFERLKSPSERLFVEGSLPPPQYRRITIVGTRKPSTYGKMVTSRMIEGLRGQPVTILSGLALGIDACAHEAAVLNNIHTIAIPGSGLKESVLYPRTNVGLAHRIISSGGALMSPWETEHAAKWMFPLRNRTMAAMSDLVLVVEAGVRSGTMITANAATEFSVPIAAIPGDIDNTRSEGTNALIKSGAHCVTDPNDLIKLLGLEKSKTTREEEVLFSKDPILSLLRKPQSRDQLIALSGLSVHMLNCSLSRLELEGSIVIDNQGIIRAR